MIAYRCNSQIKHDKYSDYEVKTINTVTGVETIHTTSVAGAFYGDTELNSPVIVGNNVANTVAFMLQNCTNFNSEVILPAHITNYYALYYGCVNFNRPVFIPDTVTNCGSMLQSCTNFNSPIVIYNGITSLSQIFYECQSFNQDVIIPESVNSLWYTFCKANNFEKNIYIKGQSFRTIRVSGMFSKVTGEKRKNILFNSILNNQFNVTNTSSITGTTVTWTSMTNGFYNSQYNIYCYYNYYG